ncbi:MAG: lysylphosphatidylglycerol synthase transmembrane domain-containing protein [archaeon]
MTANNDGEKAFKGQTRCLIMLSWKKHKSLILSVSFSVIVLVFLLSKYSLVNAFMSMTNVSLELVVKYLLAVLVIVTLGVFRWDVVLRSQHVHIPFHRLFAYRLIGNAMSYLTPGPRVGGEPFQAAAMRKEHISFTQSLSSIFIDRTVELSTSGIFFFIGIIVGFAVIPSDWRTKTVLLLTGFLLLVFIFFFFRQVLRGKTVFHRMFRFFGLHKFKRFEQYEQKILDFEFYIIKFYKKDRIHFLITLAISFLTWVAMFLEYYFLLQMFGITANISVIFLIVSFVGFAYLLPLPMALGSLEAGQVSAFSLLRNSADTGIGVSLIIRAKDIFISMIGVAFMLIYGITFKNTAVERKEERAEYIRRITEK